MHIEIQMIVDSEVHNAVEFMAMKYFDFDIQLDCLGRQKVLECLLVYQPIWRHSKFGSMARRPWFLNFSTYIRKPLRPPPLFAKILKM